MYSPGVLPVQVQTVEVVLLDEADDMLDEPGAGGGVVHQAAVLVSLAVVPASQGQGHLGKYRSIFLFFCLVQHFQCKNQELQYLEVRSSLENSKTYLDAMLLEFCHLPVHVLARVSCNEKLRLT